MKFFRWKVLLPSLLSLFLLVQFLYFNHKIIDVRKSLKARIKKHKTHIRGSDFVFYKAFHNKFLLPKELSKVPYADTEMIKRVKKIKIRDVFAPYNGALIEKKDGYWLLFRYDNIRQMYFNKIDSNVGCVELDQYLKQTNSDFFTIETNSNSSEDPRILKMGEDFLVVFNDLFSAENGRRGMHIGKINFEQKRADNVSPLDLKIATTEKNWSPFVYQDSNGESSICFEYQVSHPRQILYLENLFDPKKQEIYQQAASLASIPWEKKWGMPAGGTPARLVDGEYLAFFHSKFRDKAGILWYVLGAYTFEAQAPFRIAKVSPYPILFEGIYDNEYLNTAEPTKCVIFPGSYAIKEHDGKTLIQLACGENDSSVKVITFDKKELLESLVQIEKK